MNNLKQRTRKINGKYLNEGLYIYLLLYNATSHLRGVRKCHENDRRREARLQKKREKRKIFLLYAPWGAGMVTENPPPHIAVTTINAGTSSVRSSSLQDTPQASPTYKPLLLISIMHHTPCTPHSQTSFFQTVSHWINPPRTPSTCRVIFHATSPLLQYTLLAFPILSIWQNHRRALSLVLSSTSFITTQLYHPCNKDFIHSPYTSKPLKLSILIALILGLSSPNVILSLPYHRKGTSNAAPFHTLATNNSSLFTLSYLFPRAIKKSNISFLFLYFPSTYLGKKPWPAKLLRFPIVQWISFTLISLNTSHTPFHYTQKTHFLIIWDFF